MAEPDTKLEQFMSQEMALFFEHLQTASQKYADSGELPKSLFGVKTINRVLKQKNKRKDAGKRSLSAYNIFVKEKYEEIKRKSPAGQAPAFKEIFSQVAGMWKALGEDQKKAYAKKAQDMAAAAEGGAVVAEEPAPHSEHKHKKKKKHHHKSSSSSDSD